MVSPQGILSLSLVLVCESLPNNLKIVSQNIRFSEIVFAATELVQIYFLSGVDYVDLCSIFYPLARCFVFIV